MSADDAHSIAVLVAELAADVRALTTVVKELGDEQRASHSELRSLYGSVAASQHNLELDLAKNYATTAALDRAEVNLNNRVDALGKQASPRLESLEKWRSSSEGAAIGRKQLVAWIAAGIGTGAGIAQALQQLV